MQSTMICGRYRLPLNGPGSRPLVMGILNVTPDSFSDGGRYQALESAIDRAEQMIAEGADIVDIGAESTRPGIDPLPVAEELERLLPVLYALRDCGKPISVDTRNPLVMREALVAGADMINDVNGFRATGALEALEGSDCGICVMHMQNDPATMQVQPHYDDVCAEVQSFLHERTQELLNAGVARGRLCIDPGIGFGKTTAHNIALLKYIALLRQQLDFPLLVGVSRKSIIGTITGKPVDDRVVGSVAAAIMCAQQGADIVRVHDVGATVDALKVWQALR
ncbi:dihydropteroate synthase [Noviherbaspirillum pedocola]|uniref:Dihydropteroate synthase n=1 Tax=Noviherbaspirillum pedocola TaxID=2801341 RepID=A0A934SWE0_9BURK|nr:dihydropteroate synthase [Noviherbaspirillum pedocola]MBK4734057.1 dihydropteroate synthase [Noviherbaspirillum pedocola]